MNLYALPPHVPLLDAVALEWLQRTADPLQRAHGLILLPTRRAARALAEAFLARLRRATRSCCPASPPSAPWTRPRWRSPARSTCRPPSSRPNGSPRSPG